jgi:hypothetical protein
MKPVLLTCFAAGLWAALAAVPSSPAYPAEQKPDIAHLIAQLGSESFEARETATRRLKERDDAVAALRRVLKSGDAEVTRRAKEILDALARRENERAFTALAGAAERGAVDQAVERFVRRARWDDEASCWRVMAGLADKLTDLERETYKKASLPAYDKITERELPIRLKSFRLKTTGARGDSPTFWEHRIVLRAEEVLNGNSIQSCLFAVSGSAKMDNIISTVLFTGGSVDFAGHVARSLIVCDGDFTAQSDISYCLIIARGTIRCDGDVRDSRLISCGKIDLKQPARVYDSKVLEKEAKPLGLITFFDPADVGIKVESAEGGVRVKEAEKGKPFAAAGLRADDLVTALDGEAVKDAESFRRLLRAKLAVEGTTTFTVRRGDKTVEVAVTHKD